VIRKLASGGIADVFLAERVARGGEASLVALKRLRAHVLDDAMVTGMFADEIRLGKLCSHPNLVATLDSGSAGRQRYAVLEYVRGQTLARATHVLRKRGQRFSRAQAVAIAIELCKGLGYLHALTDASGKRLHVIHRDVTPANVLLGVDGTVKLCDLGFAKSKIQRTLTVPGLIKGKFSYLSPEAANEQPVDQRADVFAVGIMLWEMLSMRRLFHASTDYDTVKLVQQAEVPALASVDGDADGVLGEIVERSLAREPDARFASAHALHDALFAYADWQELSPELGPLLQRLSSPPSPPRRAPQPGGDASTQTRPS
jgi:serine/threonine-protein kinase